MRYNRQAAVEYAHRWAKYRNPQYYNYDELGGDCTNFASQCLYAGGMMMNYEKNFGWYYINANDKAPAWTGVSYIYNFLTRKNKSYGPTAIETTADKIEKGDLIQLAFTPEKYSHTLFVVEAENSSNGILIATHTLDADYRPLSTYNYSSARFLHINTDY